MTCLNPIGCFATPQLEKIHSGKVRESFRIDRERRLIVATDRISCFDRVLNTLIPGKGAVLTGIANYWFERTRQIIPNHLLATPHSQAIVAQEAKPIKIEMIVRGYLSGSVWCAYEQGQREFGGVTLPIGLQQNQKLAAPIITPTTKDETDLPISPAEIVESGLATKELYQRMAEVTMELFMFGSHELSQHGLVLADAKYEFGLVEGELVLIDEIHTPDCSRIWDKRSYEKNQRNPQEFDKEFVRRWLREKSGKNAAIPLFLPDDVVMETQNRYLTLYQMLIKTPLNLSDLSREGLAQKLIQAKLMKPGYIALFMGSRGDLDYAEKIASYLDNTGIFVDIRVVSAHKNGERIAEITKEYNIAAEPGAAIAIAGRSNGLGGALAASLNIPVINIPPFKDHSDLMLNVPSSLMMPSGVPAMTVIGAEQGAEAALRCLNLPHLKLRADKMRESMKQKLADDDTFLRNRAKLLSSGKIIPQEERLQ